MRLFGFGTGDIIFAKSGQLAPSGELWDICITKYVHFGLKLCPRIKFDLQIFHIFGKFCLEKSNFKFQIWPLEAKFASRGQIWKIIFDLQISNLTFSKKQDHESIIQKITINKIYHAWTQKSNLMLNLGQIFAKFYLAKFARAGSNLAKINLMRGHSIRIYFLKGFWLSVWVQRVDRCALSMAYSHGCFVFCAVSPSCGKIAPNFLVRFSYRGS